MAPSVSPKKSAIFDKIPSQGKRKEIYTATLAENTQFFCKGVGDCLLAFVPISIGDSGWDGKVEIMEGEFKSGESVIVNFTVDSDNYFMQTQVFGLGGKATLAFPKELFRLQRRTHIRVDVDPERDHGVNIIQLNKKGVFLAANCMDVSAGGARLNMPVQVVEIAAGDSFTAVFHFDDRWRFEVNGEVKHVQREDGLIVFGVEFENANRSIANRLQMMMLEMQRWVVQPQEARTEVKPDGKNDK